MKISKSTVRRKIHCVYLSFTWRKLLKVEAFVIFPASIMVLFEIHQRFKGHILNELRVSFKKVFSLNQMPLFIRRDLGTNQPTCRDKKF